MKRLGSLVVVVVGLALVLGACGSEQFPQSAGAPTTTLPPIDPALKHDPHAWLLASVAHTSSLESARVALSMKLTGLGGESFALNGSGVVDFVRRAAALTMRGADNGESTEVEVRLVGGKVYTRDDGNDWLSKPVSAADVDTPNPSSYLSYLQAISAAVRVEGHAVVRGVQTTRYRADVDFDKALAHAKTPVQRRLFAQALTMFGGVKVPVTAWVDDDGYVRKEQISLELGTAMRAAGVPVSGDPKIVLVLELFDFGAPVNISAPSGAIDVATAAQFRATQSDLRNALTAEKVVYTDNERYSTDPAMLKQIESSLDWGGKLHVVVGDAAVMSGAVICLSEASAAGPVFSLADVAAGPNAGTYYGRGHCPATIDDVTAAQLGSHW